MFSLIAGLIEYLFKRAEFQVLILGARARARGATRTRDRPRARRSRSSAGRRGARTGGGGAGVDHAGKTTVLEQMKGLFTNV